MLSFVRVDSVMVFLYSNKTVTKAAVYLHKREIVAPPNFTYQPESDTMCFKMINLRSISTILTKKFGFKMICYKGIKSFSAKVNAFIYKFQ